LFGIGANEIPGKRTLPPKDLLRQIVGRALAIHVRDTWTQKLLESCQEKVITVGICPSVNYIQAKFKRSRRKGLRNYLFHIQHPIDVEMSGGDPKRISLILRELAADLNLYYDETDHINQGINMLSRRYQRARFVISSRLHGCIFSYAFGVPFVAIVADSKTSAFIDTHVPGNPVTNVHFTKDEIFKELMFAEKYHRNLAGIPSKAALLHNMTQIQKIKTLFQLNSNNDKI
jgi:hypothetical protein